MANDLIDIESFCGFCNTRVGASLEDRRKHMFGCKKHPAYEMGRRYQQIADLMISYRKERINAALCLDSIARILAS